MLMFLKNKGCVKVKGRAIADGGKQRNGYKKSDVTSPNADTESVLITAEIDVTENRYVAVINAPQALLTEDQDEEVIFILESKMVDAMLDIDTELYGK